MAARAQARGMRECAMRYEPKLPEHNDNITHEKPVREFVTIVVGFIVVAAVLFLVLGLLVDVAVDNISPATEAKISEIVDFKRKQETSFAPEKQARLQKLVEDLGQCAGIPYKVSVELTEAKEANALVFPGGNIVVFSRPARQGRIRKWPCLRAGP